MTLLLAPFRYLAKLETGKLVLWCYLIWYLVVLFFYFDPSPAIWINSIGISVIIGIALLLSVGGSGAKRPDRWQIFRLFLMPFCVSSFSSLIKGQGFIFIIPPKPVEQITAIVACATFVLFIVVLKRVKSNVATD